MFHIGFVQTLWYPFKLSLERLDRVLTPLTPTIYMYLFRHKQSIIGNESEFQKVNCEYEGKRVFNFGGIISFIRLCILQYFVMRQSK